MFAIISNEMNAINDKNTDSGKFESLSSDELCKGVRPTTHAADNGLGDHIKHPYTFSSQNRPPDFDTFGVQVRFPNTTRNIEADVINGERNCTQLLDAVESVCHVKLDSLIELKDSTRKLLSLLEQIQAKKQSNRSNFRNQLPALTNPKLSAINSLPLVTGIFGAETINKLETEPDAKEAIFFEEDEEDICSVYKILTRKCQCLNQLEYNNFVIEFNDTKYFTSTIGEIIKNLRILKKFLYMGGDFARNALMFLNEGLSDSTYTEKVDITEGCAHADICNVFDDYSIVTVCISWPCKYENYGDATTQALTASLLYKLAQLEVGRRYLKFSSKITNYLKNVLRKQTKDLNLDTVESLNATLSIMHPLLVQETNIASCRKIAGEIKIEEIAEYQSPYSYKRHITIQTYRATVQNFTIRRPKIIPMYTD